MGHKAPSIKEKEAITIAREDKETAIKRIMNGLKCDRAEAEEVYAYDVAVNHDEKTEFDATPEQLKVQHEMTKTGTRKAPTAFKFTKRERKPNATKGGLITDLAQFLRENSSFAVENLEIVNKERQIAFEIGGEKFELTLVQKRKPKK